MTSNKTKTKDKIKNLLADSRILKEKMKNRYWSVLNFLSEADLQELLVMLETEQKGISEIESREKAENQDFYLKSMAALKDILLARSKKITKAKAENPSKEMFDVAVLSRYYNLHSGDLGSERILPQGDIDNLEADYYLKYPHVISMQEYGSILKAENVD